MLSYNYLKIISAKLLVVQNYNIEYERTLLLFILKGDFFLVSLGMPVLL